MERRAFGDPGIDDQQVDRAVEGAGFVEGVADLLGVGDVAADRRPAQFFTDRQQRLHPPSQQRQFGARGVKLFRRSGADTRAAAGDQRMAPIKLAPH